ncbi:MAG: DUF3916 domain-containing protein [Eubacterium sp.]|nr:DUF3916 domain-containing protein [Eubacterium sp.]
MLKLKQDRKKQRGQSQKLKSMFRYIDKFTPFSEADEKYEHFHVPSSSFIGSKRTSGKTKTEFCRKWLETTEMFISQKPSDIPFSKVVAVLSVPDYWRSQIIIFYDESYYKSFWKRNGPEQYWTPIKQNYSFCKKRNIKASLQEICYHEKIVNEEGLIESERDLWFYGDLPDNEQTYQL